MASNSLKLGLREFFADLKMVLISPSERFAVIQERGAIWGSLFLLAIPYYFAFEWLGGVFFDSSPFPGYAFLIPAVVAILLALLRMAMIHLVALGLRGKRRHLALKGAYRSLLVVFGYSTVPGILALVVGFLLFFLMPIHANTLLRDYRGVTISIIIAAGIALFVWQLILAVLALRTIYSIGDGRLILSLLLGSILAGIGSTLLSAASVTIETDYRYLQPMLSERMMRFVTASPFESFAADSKTRVGLDNLAYRFKAPRRFDVVAYSTLEEASPDSHHGRILFWKPAWAGRVQAVGRIVGLPGDTVEMVDGQLKINGQPQAEPYLAPESRSNQSLPMLHLGDSEYAIFPENRNLLKPPESDYRVERIRISGRLILNKWPFGWCFFKPNVFLKAPQSPATAQPMKFFRPDLTLPHRASLKSPVPMMLSDARTDS
jgi:signal peptidase I